MISELAVWLILLLPLASFVICALVIRPFLNHQSHLAGLVTIAAVGVAFVLSLWAFASVVDAHGRVDFPNHSWLVVDNFELTVGVLLDPLTAIMLVVVSGVSLVVQVYSMGYMRGDPGFARYFAYMSLFTASMLGLVIASNVILLFVFWELVGLGSYLLIGFWYQRPAAAAAAKKAFLMTRLGDFGFLLAIMYLFFNADAFTAQGLNPLVIADIYEAVGGDLIAAGVAGWIAVGLFAGAAGKSAQFPLHTWLPDAMEGPTPVSSLIHAATMVAAGVFLVARFMPLFELSQQAMTLVALIGGVTALFAASMGLVATDIKRVLAYSTVSQLGYMMLALGVGAYGPALFHLFTHAFFKALLFLGSGSVNHATGTFDMRYMGGLRKVMPWTHATFLVGALSLAGVFPLAGFWSKDEILAHALAGDGVSRLVFALALAAAFMTAFYIFRALFLTFEGRYRGGASADPEAEPHGSPHLAEAPTVMVWPLLPLAAASVAIGFLINPPFNIGIVPAHWLSEFLGTGPVHVEAAKFDFVTAVVSTALAGAGIVLAYLMYVRESLSPQQMTQRLRGLHRLLVRKYYMDELYEGALVTRAFYGGLARALDWGDKAVVDKAVNYVGWMGRNVGRPLRQVQTGQLQGYGLAISAGILVIFGVYLLFL